MRVALIGCGNQGKKRYAVAKDDIILTIDPYVDQFATLIPHRNGLPAGILDFDAALVCTPDEPKRKIVTTLLDHGKHVLVEKPFEPTQKIIKLAAEKNLVCYTAYNHRFEPNVMRMEKLIRSEELGQLYYCRMFYGFGTVGDVKGTWRDRDLGCFTEIGSHLLDLCLYWFGIDDFYGDSPFVARFYELKNAFDGFTWCCPSNVPDLQLEGSWISWKNTFTVDLYGEKGSAHINGLTKWGISTFTRTYRKRPSGKPEETVSTFSGFNDPTWDTEYAYFKQLCGSPEAYVDHHAAHVKRDKLLADIFNDIREKRR